MKTGNKNGKTSEEDDKRHIETFLRGVPFLGGFFKELGKTDAFKEKFKETNKKIEENLKKRGKKQWAFESKVSVRPILQDTDMSSEITIKEDYAYKRKENRLYVMVKVPNHDANAELNGKLLRIVSKDFGKELELPDYFNSIKKKQYENGILMLELIKWQ